MLLSHHVFPSGDLTTTLDIIAKLLGQRIEFGGTVVSVVKVSAPRAMENNGTAASQLHSESCRGTQRIAHILPHSKLCQRNGVVTIAPKVVASDIL